MNVPKSVFGALPRSRNPFEILKLFPAIPLVPKKKTDARKQSPSLNVAEAKITQLLENGSEATSIDSVFKTPVDEEPSSERNKKKAHLITIKSNFSSAVEDLLREKKR